MCACGSGFGRLAFLTGLITLTVPGALGQWERGAAGRLAALNARPAAVGLTATLESLSVTASPADSNNGRPGDRGVNRWVITMAWAIPANCTTIRLTGYFPNPAASGEVFRTVQDQDWEAGDPPNNTLSQAFALPGEAGSRSAAGMGGITLVTQPMGATSLPDSRSDNILIAPGRVNIRPDAAIGRELSILVQAL